MAQFLVRYQETRTDTVVVEGVDTIDDAVKLVSDGPEFINEDDLHDTWHEKVVHFRTDVDTERQVIGTDTINLG